MMGRLKGYILAALAAAAYGTNPAFAIPLYETGMNPTTVLFFRYALGIPLLGLMILARGMNFRLRKAEIMPVFFLGVLMALSSLTLFESYRYMNSGVASTLLFVYPIMVAVIMIFFFHENFKPSLPVCFCFMIGGLVLLMRNGGEEGSFGGYGFLLVMISALTYALYIVLVNVSKSISRIPTTKLLFYVLIFGSLVFLFMFWIGTPFTLPVHSSSWWNLIALAVIPTVLSLACTSAAIRLIGSTPTAIFGALEPVTAVVLSVLLLGQGLSIQEISGGILIVIATSIVVASRSVDRFILHVRKMFPRHRIGN